MTSTPPRRRRIAPLIWLASLAAVILLGLTAGLTMSAFTASITNTTDTATAGTLLMTETGVSGVGSTSSCYSNGTATGGITATNAGSCTIINKFGAATLLTPSTTAAGSAPAGTIPATTPATAGTNQNTGIIKLTNNGSTSASTALSISGTTCTQATPAPAAPVGSAASLCAKLDVAIYSGLAGAAPTAPTAGTALTYGTQIFYGTAASLGTTTALADSTVPTSQSVYLTFVVWLDGSADNTYQGQSASTPITFTFTN